MVYAEFLIPFFFTLAIVYGALEVSDVCKNKRVILLISIVLGFFSISNPMVVNFINSIIPYAVILFVAFFFLGFLLSFFKKKDKKPDYSLLIIIAGLALIFLSTDNGILDQLSIPADSIVPWVVLVIILLIFLAAYFKGTDQ